MTDKELARIGERLYEAVLLTPLPAGTILGLATAIRYNAPWSELPRALRFAVFKIAAACLVEGSDAAQPDSPPDPNPPQGDGMHATGPAEDVAAAAPGDGSASAPPVSLGAEDGAA